MNSPVFHISAPPGTGKTTLMRRVRRQYGRQVVTRDLDNIENFQLERTRRRIKRSRAFDRSPREESVKSYRGVMRRAGRRQRPVALFGIHGKWLPVGPDRHNLLVPTPLPIPVAKKIRLKVSPWTTLWRRAKRKRGFLFSPGQPAPSLREQYSAMREVLRVSNYRDVKASNALLDQAGYVPMRARKILKLLGRAAT